MKHTPESQGLGPIPAGRGQWGIIKALARVGPGLVTGAADDDPSGIATYSQAGAQFGLDMLWTMPLAYPLMSAIQCLCAFIGRVTGQGLAANIKATYSPLVLKCVVLALLFANTLNIAADLAAMGEAAELVTHFDRHLMTAGFVAVCLALQILVPYRRYVFVLKWLALSLLAYAAVLFVVHVPWGQVARHTLWPRFTPNGAAAAVIVGVFGTTISPYLFFWQASQEVEDMQERGERSLLRDEAAAPRELSRIRWDTWSGMLYSDLTAYFIILATAVTLHRAGVNSVETAAQAASALRPLAGDFAFSLFALGIIGVGLLGVPVLAGSAAYALSEAMGWRTGLARKPGEARAFYTVIAASVLAALAIQYSPVNPMKALFLSAIINGVVAVPLMALIILIATKASVMGPFKASRALIALGWIATALMGAAAVRMLIPG
jgi:NRAMP (natural resistance-associated macrophage protein)-like metal ion transporter